MLRFLDLSIVILKSSALRTLYIPYRSEKNMKRCITCGIETEVFDILYNSSSK
jgi:hypothetical protein